MQTIFLILHFLSDFFFQSTKMAINKEKDIKVNLFHSILYSVPFIPFLFFSNLIFSIVIIITTHALIDLIFFFLKKIPKIKLNILFIIDQVLHISIIFFVCFKFKEEIVIPFSNQFIKYCLFFIIITKPISISFQKLFPGLRKNEENERNFGAIIGYLERILIGIFLILNQYSAIGFIIAAKAFARSNSIQSNTLKCEYFLVGTFYSILSVISIYLIMFKIDSILI